MYKHHHEWHTEVVEGTFLAAMLDPDTEIKENLWHQDAAELVAHAAAWVETEAQHIRPMVTRDVVDEEGSVIDRSWAYMHQSSDEGKWGLPDYFTDETGVNVAPVPKYLHDQLARAQA